jgi:hypothetical protein
VRATAQGQSADIVLSDHGIAALVARNRPPQVLIQWSSSIPGLALWNAKRSLPDLSGAVESGRYGSRGRTFTDILQRIVLGGP